MRVLVVGGGGREHALAWGLARSGGVDALYCAPGNAGTARLGMNLAVDAEDVRAVVDTALEHKIDFAVVGPEVPLAAGLIDALEARDVLAFGPRRAAAEIEASKSYAKSVMERANVPHARGRAFSDAAGARRYAASLADVTGRTPIVKANGLAAGKGVIVPGDLAEAEAAIDDLLGGRFEAASATVVVEEQLAGLEASAMAFVDGGTVLPMPLACDYKRVGDGDAGPNTGGMGVYSPPGFIAAENVPAIFTDVHQPVAVALQAEARPYRGVLYAGLMVEGTANNVLEFNCRFGDPETQVVLPLLESGLLDLLRACAEGRLGEVDPVWSGDTSVGVVLASGGYPSAYETGKPIGGLDAVDDDVLIFHAGTTLDGDAVVTAGGRVLVVVARAPTLAEAREHAYENVARITFDGRHYREDIAAREMAAVAAPGEAGR